jgi:peptide/nickel transport system ATP-binding protein
MSAITPHQSMLQAIDARVLSYRSDDSVRADGARGLGLGALLSIEQASAHYGGRGGLLGYGTRRAPLALDGVSLTIRPGETLALVGESGSGKSTLARAIAGLQPLSGGRLRFAGAELAPRAEQRPMEVRRRIQMVFQNPDASLNPRHRIGDAVGRPLQLFFDMPRTQRERNVASLLAAVRLPEDYARRFPAEISGGERQRVAIARALAARPSLLLCDEIVSALDVSVQASLLELLRSVTAETGLAMLFITHDLAVARWFADRVAVLYRGRLCEVAPTDRLFAAPSHPYTASLLAALRPGDPGSPSASERGRHPFNPTEPAAISMGKLP